MYRSRNSIIAEIVSIICYTNSIINITNIFFCDYDSTYNTCKEKSTIFPSILT